MGKINVINSLKQRINDSSYEENPTYFGAEQRFISPIRGSDNCVNNLEEQNIFGVSTYAKTTRSTRLIDDQRVTVTETHKSFCSNPIEGHNYYRLVTIKYDPAITPTGGVNFKFLNNKLIIPYPDGDASFDDTNHVLVTNNANIYVFDGTTFKIYPNFELLSQEDKLYFLQDNSSTETDENLVLRKDTLYSVNSLNEEITKEVVTNVLRQRIEQG